jgi:hypothetical protein
MIVNKLNNEGILGIKNRAENWETAQTFAPIMANERQHILANQIISNSKQVGKFKPQDVRIELFWKGFRDYCYDRKIDRNNKEFKLKIAKLYRKLFPNLSEKLQKYQEAAKGSSRLKIDAKLNYNPDRPNFKDNLYQNLGNTEVDIVLEAPGFVLIGEAKRDETFGAKSKHSLPHQLIRQYVMTVMLKHLLLIEGQDKTEILPFVIGDDVEKFAQIKAMIFLGCLDKSNIFSWKNIETLGAER